MAANGCAAVEHSAMLGSLRRKLGGIPEGILKEYFSETLVDLCQRGGVWRYVFEALKVYPDQVEYQLPVEKGSMVDKVETVYYAPCGTHCNSNEYRLPEREDIQRGSECCGGEQGWYEPEPGLLIFNACFSECGNHILRVDVRLRPEHGATLFPQALMDKYKLLIEQGVMAKAHLEAGQPWSDVERANYFGNLFERKMNEIKAKRRRDMPVGRPTYRRGAYMSGR